MAFYGGKLMFQVIGFSLALFITAVLFILCYNLFLPRDLVWLLFIVLFLCAVVGGYVSFFTYSFAKTWGVSLISGWSGLALGLILAKLLLLQNATLSLLMGLGGSITGAWFGKKLNNFVKSIVTSTFGSYCFFKGVHGYLGGMP